MPSRTRSVSIVLLAAALWGISGTVAQALFDRYGFPPLGLVTLRMSFSGLFLLVALRPRFPKERAGRLVLFSLIGLFAVQASYFLAIANSNSPTATLLQSLSLPMMAVFEGSRSRSGRSLGMVFAVLFAAAGTVLLTLGEARAGLTLTVPGLVFGLISAITAAYYTLDSRTLTRVEDPWAITGWSMLIGGLFSVPFGLPTLVSFGSHSFGGDPVLLLALILFVIVAGTLIPFGLYLEGRDVISGTEAGVAGVMEPISATVVALLFLGVVLTPLQYVGGALMLGSVVYLSWMRPAPPNASGGTSRPPKG